MTKGLAALSTIIPALALSAACAVHQDDVPGLTGPSDLALSVTVTATPSTILRDGQSQSAIVVRAFDANGQPQGGVTFRMDTFLDGSQVDFGTLSARTIVTGSDGRATAVYTAPVAAPVSAAAVPRTVTISAEPVGNNAQAALKFTADITLMPPGVILGVVTFAPDFTFLPAGPTQGTPVSFDSAPTQDPNNAIVAFAWDFGDGSTATGRTASHEFTAVRAYTVTLTAFDELGRAASRSKVVTVGAGAEPTVDFTFSPTAPATNQDITFVATAKSGVAGHSIVRFDWQFGTGSTRSGQVVTKSYDTIGTYTVTLTVTDDLGITKSVSKTVTVANGLSAEFTFSPTDPKPGTVITFDGSKSVAVSGVATFDWDFGDATGGATGKTVQHTYTTAATYVVRLTITDTAGRTATTSSSVTVKP